MTSFNEIKKEYKRFQDEFSKNIRDNFGSSIYNEGLEPIDQHLEVLCMQENKLEIEIVNIQGILLESKAIVSDLGA